MVAETELVTQQYLQPLLSLLSEEEELIPDGHDWYLKKYFFMAGTTLASVYRQEINAGNCVLGDPLLGERLVVFIPGVGEVLYTLFANGVSRKVRS